MSAIEYIAGVPLRRTSLDGCDGSNVISRRVDTDAGPKYPDRVRVNSTSIAADAVITTAAVTTDA